MHVIWTGERVRLRPFRDEEELCGLSHAINATPNAFWGPNHLPSPKLKRDFEPGGMLSPDGRCIFVIERLDTAEAVGIEICRLPSPGAIMGNAGTLILEQHWHRGFGIEAKQLCFCFQFESAPVERIEAATLAHHTRARAGLLRSGMHCEGAILRYLFDSGKFHDCLLYAIFREEWEKLPIRGIVRRG